MAKLKSLLLLIFITVLLTGCSKNSSQDIVGVINKYLESSSKLQWEGVEQLLTGEALLETRVNKDKVKNKEEILDKKMDVRYLTDKLATATVDVIKNNDRIAYKFHLIKKNNYWLIYKVEYGDYLHDELKLGQLPQGVEALIKTYIELPKVEKDKRNRQFLAGPLLRASMKKLAYKGIAEEQRELEVTEKVKDIKCLGAAKDYVLAEVVSEVNAGEGKKNYSISAIYHLVNVKGVWKVCRMDVVELR